MEIRSTAMRSPKRRVRSRVSIAAGLADGFQNF
jgi:hypothetical protein